MTVSQLTGPVEVPLSVALLGVMPSALYPERITIIILYNEAMTK